MYHSAGRLLLFTGNALAWWDLVADGSSTVVTANIRATGGVPDRISSTEQPVLRYVLAELDSTAADVLPTEPLPMELPPDVHMAPTDSTAADGLPTTLGSVHEALETTPLVPLIVSDS